MSRLVSGLALVVLITGCATLSQVVALHQVRFDLDRVSGATLAGVRLDRARASDLSATDLARLAAAVAARDVPLVMTVYVRGENPATNRVTARLVRFDWTLLLDDRETVSGTLDRGIRFPPGQPTDVPLAIELDLYDFVGGRAEDLYTLARAAIGGDGRMRIALEATPTIETELGPIRYPAPIRIVEREAGVP